MNKLKYAHGVRMIVIAIRLFSEKFIFGTITD